VIWLDRYEGRWDLSARSERPAEAAALANAWLNASVTALERAVEHALRVQELQRSMYELGCALEESADGSQVLWGCVVGDPEEGDDLPEVLVDEIERSKGVIPGLTFAALRQANAPTEPLYRGRTWLLLGGLLAGLAVGLFLVVLGLGDSANGSGAQ
ncbi:MAG: hypothetical protein GWN58_06380, partial [Anaerolineae bacterium]|nr:hypothetical protein [Anaerolineae bacterium]